MVPTAAGSAPRGRPKRRALAGVSSPWQDPHNADRRFTRSRLRLEVLPLLEDVLGGGVAEALARTATALQEDGEVFDTLSDRAVLAAVCADRSARRCADGLGPSSAIAGSIRSWLLAGGARRLDRQTDPRSRHAGHGLARSGRRGCRHRTGPREAVRRAPRRRSAAAPRARLTQQSLPLVLAALTWHAVDVPAHTAELYPGDIKSVLLSSEDDPDPDGRARRAACRRVLPRTEGEQDLLLVTVLKGAVMFVTDLAPRHTDARPSSSSWPSARTARRHRRRAWCGS